MIVHDTQIRLHRGEGIVGYLRLSRGDRRQQGALSRIGEAHQAHICQQLQLQNHHHLLHRLTRLRKVGCLTRSSGKVHIAPSALAASQQNHLLSVFSDIAHILTRLSIIDHRAAGNVDDLVFSLLACALVLRAVFAVARHDVAVELQVQQRPVVAVATQYHVSASTTVTTIGTTLWHVLCSVHVCGAFATLSRATIDLHIINEIRFCHVCFAFRNTKH